MDFIEAFKNFGYIATALILIIGGVNWLITLRKDVDFLKKEFLKDFDFIRNEMKKEYSTLLEKLENIDENFENKNSELKEQIERILEKLDKLEKEHIIIKNKIG